MQKIRDKLDALTSTLDRLNTALENIKAKLEPLAATDPEVAAALQQLAAVDLSKLNMSDLDTSELSLDTGSMSSLINDIGIDSLSIDDLDLDLTIDLNELMPVQNIETDYYHGSSGWEMFDFLGPIFIALFLFVFIFITCSFSLVNERAAGTMERFLDTPVRSVQILAGYVIGFGAMSLL